MKALLLILPALAAASDVAQEGAFLPIPSRPPELVADEHLPLEEHARGLYLSALLWGGGEDRLSAGSLVRRDGPPFDGQAYLHLLRADHGHSTYRHFDWVGAWRQDLYLRAGTDPRAAEAGELDWALGAYAQIMAIVPGGAWIELGDSAERGSHYLLELTACIFHVAIEGETDRRSLAWGLTYRWPGGASANTPNAPPWSLAVSLDRVAAEVDDHDVDGVALQIDLGTRLWEHWLLQGHLRWQDEAWTGEGREEALDLQIGLGLTW